MDIYSPQQMAQAVKKKRPNTVADEIQPQPPAPSDFEGGVVNPSPAPGFSAQNFAGNALGAVGKAFSQPDEGMQVAPLQPMQDYGIIGKPQTQTAPPELFKSGDVLEKAALL